MTALQVLIKYSESIVQLLTILKLQRGLYGKKVISLAGQKDVKDKLWLFQRHQDIDYRRQVRLAFKPSYHSVKKSNSNRFDSFSGCRPSDHRLQKTKLVVSQVQFQSVCMIHATSSKYQKMGAQSTNNEVIESSNRQKQSSERKDKLGWTRKNVTNYASSNMIDGKYKRTDLDAEEENVNTRISEIDKDFPFHNDKADQDEPSVNVWSTDEEKSTNRDKTKRYSVEKTHNIMKKAQVNFDSDEVLIEGDAESITDNLSSIDQEFSFNINKIDMEQNEETVNSKNEDSRKDNSVVEEPYKTAAVSETPDLDELETDNDLDAETIIKGNIHAGDEFESGNIEDIGKLTEPEHAEKVEVTLVDGEVTTDFLEEDVETSVQKDEILKKTKHRKRSSHSEKSDLSQPVDARLSQMILDPQNYPIQRRILEFLEENGLPFVESYTGYYVVCPKYGKVAMRRKKEEQSIYVNYLTGDFKCNSCGKTGNWNLLKDNITHILLKKGRRKSMMECFENVLTCDTYIDEEIAIDKVQEALDEAKDLSRVNSEEFENILSLFDWQGISKNSFRKYGVKYIQQGNRYKIYFPTISMDKELTGARVYNAVITEDEDVKLEPVYTVPGMGNGEMFGWQTRPEPDNKNFYSKLVITTGEIQAMAITQATTLTAISIQDIDNFPQEFVPTLEKFEKIYLWLGTDLKAWEMSKFIARKLNEKRCLIFRPANVNEMPLECIQMEQDIREKLKLARPLCHEAIHSFQHLRLDVYREFYHHEHVTGVKWKRYDKLNNILKGFRQGELTVLTGPTGSGKTTFLSDYSLDLCMQGVKTLWGSFEICNVRLIKMMMQQYSGINLTKHLDDFEEVADVFTELPMFFMAYHGQQNVEMVLETMCHAVYVHNIQHIIIDNLQFMVGMERFEDQPVNIFFRQDQIVSKFRKFATDNNCHVTLIIHPRKIDKGEELSIASIFGSAKVSQESDNILLIQDNRLTKPGGRKYLQIVKNRFDGDLGVMVLTFNKDSLCFTMNEKKKAMPTA